MGTCLKILDEWLIPEWLAQELASHAMMVTAECLQAPSISLADKMESAITAVSGSFVQKLQI